MGRYKSGSEEPATPFEDFDFLAILFEAFLCGAGSTIRGCGTALKPFGSVSKFSVSTPSSRKSSTDSGMIKLDSIPLHS